MRPSVLQEDTAERERAESKQRQKLKQKARNKERAARKRAAAAAEREACEREACSRRKAEAKQQEVEAAVQRWGHAYREDREAPAWCKALAWQKAETSSRGGRATAESWGPSS